MIGGTNDIGQRNIKFIKQFLVTEGYKTVAEDLGGMQPRKIMYNVQDGRLMVQKLKCQHHDRYLQLEIDNQRRNQVVHNDDVELFTD